ncbi:hypothetical protein BASA60_011581 [Batrachochytrium salamandrivorans]|nr:hypothetical protein BASA60_011581 [Batrachochytrium salamandrivorans]
MESIGCDYYYGGDKPYLVSGSDDKTIKVWDYQTSLVSRLLRVTPTTLLLFVSTPSSLLLSVVAKMALSVYGTPIPIVLKTRSTMEWSVFGQSPTSKAATILRLVMTRALLPLNWS